MDSVGDGKVLFEALNRTVVYHPPHLTTTSGGSSGNLAEIWWKSGGNPLDIHWILINSIQNN